MRTHEHDCEIVGIMRFGRQAFHPFPFPAELILKRGYAPLSMHLLRPHDCCVCSLAECPRATLLLTSSEGCACRLTL